MRTSIFCALTGHDPIWLEKMEDLLSEEQIPTVEMMDTIGSLSGGLFDLPALDCTLQSTDHLCHYDWFEPKLVKCFI